MWPWTKGPSCPICKDTEEGTLLRVEKNIGMGYPLVWRCHEECLKRVVCNPEKYPDWVKYAYSLTKEIEAQEDRRNHEIAALKRLQSKYKCKDKM